MMLFELGDDEGRGAYVEVMPLFFRIQHILLIILLSVLCLTGFAILFHRTGMGRALVELEGGVVLRGLLHRAAALCLLLLCVYHLYYIFLSREGKVEFKNLAMKRKDLQDFTGVMRFNMTLTDTYPEMDRYSYREKFQYWGVGAGIFIMIGTGIMLWFESATMSIFPKWMMDVILIVHGYDGLIIFLILLLWHMYNVHLSSGRFPMSTTWLTGKADLGQIRRERTLFYKKLTGEEEK
jgi:cytochrome b subunit of formate dehydrogenase